MSKIVWQQLKSVGEMTLVQRRRKIDVALTERASPIIECLGASDRSLPSIIFDDWLISDIQGRWRSVLPPLLPIMSTTSDTPISLSPYSPVIALWLSLPLG